MEINIENIKKVEFFDMEGSGYGTIYERCTEGDDTEFSIRYVDTGCMQGTTICQYCGAYNINGMECVNGCNENSIDTIDEDGLIDVIIDVYNNPDELTGIAINDHKILYRV